MSLKKKLQVLEPEAKLFSGRVVSLQVKMIDKYAPDRALLFTINMLDKHVPNRLISFIIAAIEKYVPENVRASIITAADEYVPDTAADSRKVCTFFAGVGKYIPDRIIPPDSSDKWENIKLKFHIPTLLSSEQGEPHEG